jgi:acyl transferase domain-containing protein
MAISNYSSVLNGHVEVNGNGIQNEPVKPYEPVAIIGCAMRLPGHINNSESLWDLLINKRDGRCRVPSDRYNVEAFYGPGKPGCVANEYG